MKAFAVQELGPLPLGDMLHGRAIGLRVFAALRTFHEECRHEFDPGTAEGIVIPVAKTKSCTCTGATVALPVENGSLSLRCDLRKKRHDAGLPVRLYL